MQTGFQPINLSINNKNPDNKNQRTTLLFTTCCRIRDDTAKLPLQEMPDTATPGALKGMKASRVFAFIENSL